MDVVDSEEFDIIGILEEAGRKIDKNAILEAMLFVEDLVEYVLRKLGYVWTFEGGVRKRSGDSIKRIFTITTGQAVFTIITQHIDEIVDAFRNLRRRDMIKKIAIRQQLIETVPIYMKSCYNHQSFLLTAASFVGVAAIFLERGNRAMADASTEVLSLLLSNSVSKGKLNESDWFKMREAADIINNCSNEPDKSNVLPTLTEKFERKVIGLR